MGIEEMAQQKKAVYAKQKEEKKRIMKFMRDLNNVSIKRKRLLCAKVANRDKMSTKNANGEIEAFNFNMYEARTIVTAVVNMMDNKINFMKTMKESTQEITKKDVDAKKEEFKKKAEEKKQEMTEKAKEKAKDLSEEDKEKAKALAEKAKEKGKDLMDKAKSKGEEMKKKMKDIDCNDINAKCQKDQEDMGANKDPKTMMESQCNFMDSKYA